MPAVAVFDTAFHQTMPENGLLNQRFGEMTLVPKL
ncbi:MAG: hypothetical protein ABWX97_13710 [Domibacillus tundrae]|nr:hypothetical protein [Domibacillus tundrae]